MTSPSPSLGHILVLPGDHAGPEVVAEALKVLQIVEKHAGAGNGRKFEYTHELVGGCSIDEHGVPVTERVLGLAKGADAVLFGSVGGPEWGTAYPNPESGLLSLRQALQAFANLRPCNFASKSLVHRSPLKPEIVAGVDFMLVRENCGGAYFGPKVEASEGDGKGDFASDSWAYSRAEIERVARVAGSLAMQHVPPLRVTSSDKANVLASGRLWRRVVTEVFEKEFPRVELVHQLADSLAMIMMQDPRRFNGVIVTDNTFGDMLSDEAGGVTGSLGLLPSASLCGVPGREEGKGAPGLYEPVHGSAPDIAGKGLVNPVAQILSAAMMLRYSFGMKKEAEAIEKAVEKVLDAREEGGMEMRTGDLGGKASTKEMGDAICTTLEKILGGAVSNGTAR
ncbi:MAG: hypothetical protein Q9160_004089 [Pyrenula sp. 1 TL-2023]